MLLAAALPAAAGTFSIAPVRVELSQGEPTAVLTVHNDDDAPLVVQATALDWTQPEGADAYGATRELLVTPPLFTLPAHGEQIVRVALRRAPDGARELDYRLLLAEVPPPAAADFTGLRIALRLNLPVFVHPAVAASADLDWQARWLEDGGLEVSATNRGGAHLQVIGFELGLGDAGTLHAGTSRYVLPGSTVSWMLRPEATVARDAVLNLHGYSDQGEFRREIASSGG
jgi:fimbrial chaperone protein